VYSNEFAKIVSFLGRDLNINHFFIFLLAYNSKSSHAMHSTFFHTFFSFLSHSFVFNHVSFGFSTQTYLDTLEISVIGTNNLSLFLYSRVIYSFLIQDNSFITISLKIQIQ
jgi:hypothetical protein